MPTDHPQRITTLQALTHTARSVSEDLEAARRYDHAGQRAITEVALQAAECKAGLRDLVNDPTTSRPLVIGRSPEATPTSASGPELAPANTTSPSPASKPNASRNASWPSCSSGPASWPT